MKKKIILFDVVLSGAAQGLDDDVIIHALPCVLIKGFVLLDKNISDFYDIEVWNVKEHEYPETYMDKLVNANPFMVGFSCYTWNFMHIINATNLLKQKLPNTVTIWGGPEVSYTSVELMNKYNFIDLIVCGAGETAFKRVLLSFLNLDTILTIPALTHRIDNFPIKNEGVFTENLELIPSPFQNNLIDLNSEGKHAVYLETFRGCPKKCGYCLWGVGLKKLLYYSMEQILTDIELIYNNPNVVNVYVVDAFLFYNPKRAFQILEKIQSCKYQHPTFLEFDPLHLKAEYIPYVKPVCKSDYRIGVQSFIEEALSIAGRSKTGREVIESKINMLRTEDSDAKISFAVIYGLPGDSLGGFRDTLSYSLTLKPDSLKINVLSILLGSTFWEKRVEMGLFFEEDPPHRLIKSNDFTEQDLEECELLSAWFTYVMRFKLVKETMYKMIDYGLLPEPIEFIDSIIELLKPVETWIDDKYKRVGISVEEENQRRIFIINQSDNANCKLNIYNATIELLKNLNSEVDLGSKILKEIDFYKTFGYFPLKNTELWKR